MMLLEGNYLGRQQIRPSPPGTPGFRIIGLGRSNLGMARLAKFARRWRAADRTGSCFP